MKLSLKFSSNLILLVILSTTVKSQNKIPSLYFKGSFGSATSSQNFFKNGTSLNIPSSSSIGLEIGLPIAKNEFYVGLLMQARIYYPSTIEKQNLGFLSAKFGRLKGEKFADNKLEIEFGYGGLIGTLVELKSSRFGDSVIYKGNPIKNLNIGAYSEAAIWRIRKKIDFGIGVNISIDGLQLLNYNSLPSAIINNYSFNYSLSFIIRKH